MSQGSGKRLENTKIPVENNKKTIKPEANSEMKHNTLCERRREFRKVDSNEKRTYSRRAYICCTDEVTTPRRGRYRQKIVRASPPIYHCASAFIRRQLYVSVRLPPSPLPLSLFLASLATAWRSRLLCASSLCHLAMKQSAASTTPRHHFPLFLAAFAHVAGRPGGSSG